MISYFGQPWQNKKYGNFVSISSSTKVKKTFAVPAYGQVYIIWSYYEAKIKSTIFDDFAWVYAFKPNILS